MGRSSWLDIGRPNKSQLQRCSACDLAKVFLTFFFFLVFSTPPIKLKLELQIAERRLIANHLDRSLRSRVEKWIVDSGFCQVCTQKPKQNLLRQKWILSGKLCRILGVSATWHIPISRPPLFGVKGKERCSNDAMYEGNVVECTSHKIGRSWRYEDGLTPTP
jgi:hypothetical protein